METKLLFATTLIIFLGLFSGCAFTKELETDTDQKILIGAILPETGRFAQYAEEVKRGMSLVDNNNAGVEIVFADSQSEPKAGVSAYQNLVNDDIHYVITGGSSISLAIAPLANRDKNIQMAVFSSVAEYTSPDDYTFRVTSRSEIESGRLVQFIVKKNIKDVNVIYVNDSWGQGHLENIKSELAKAGIKINHLEGLLNTEMDFKSTIIKMKNENFPVVLILQDKQAGVFIKQAQELRARNSQYFGMRAVESKQFVDTVKDLSVEIYYPYSFEPDLNQSWVKIYWEKYHELPTAYVAEGYDALSVVLVALNKCEVKNTDCVKQALLNDRLDYLGVSGFNGFDENGDVILPFYIRTVKNGEAVRAN